ncbi:MAG: hypothetical protein HKL96_09900 [Phycisphaerales bacterium]|nr:hypothetical protein [Phycisphaerales bacterium]
MSNVDFQPEEHRLAERLRHAADADATTFSTELHEQIMDAVHAAAARRHRLRMAWGIGLSSAAVVAISLLLQPHTSSEITVPRGPNQTAATTPSLGTLSALFTPDKLNRLLPSQTMGLRTDAVHFASFLWQQVDFSSRPGGGRAQ